MEPSDPSTPTDDRNPIEAIASDFAESIRGGRRSSIEPVVDANPEHEPELRELLPLIHRLEKARQTHVERPGGLASLGAARPDRLGDFELVRQIGRGGMGVVFEAVQKSLSRKVAVKVLPKSLLVDDNQLKRFEREARMAGSLHHTNIVPVFGVGEDQGFHYYVMQRIEGRGLDRILADDGAKKFTPQEVARLGQQAASALAYAHECGVLHRDIKPANLIIDDAHNLWVADFGVAKAIESEAVTRTGDVVGTLRYMAPEQIVGVTDVRSDLYSLGVTLYEILAGRPAMDDGSVREALVARRAAPTPPRLRQLNPDVPRDLETILETAMAPDASLRYASAETLADDLGRFLDGQTISVRRLSTLEIGWRWARHNPAVASLSALSLALLLSVAMISTMGYLKVQSSLSREQQSRLEAEASASIASGALDQIFDRFATTPSDQANSSAEFASTPALSSEAADLLEELLPYYDELAARSEFDPVLRQSAADARYSIGNIHFQLGNYERAIEAFQLAQEGAQADSPSDSASGRLHEAQIRNRIGLAHRMLGDREQAEAEHQAALDLLTEIEQDELADEIQFELARTHYLFAARVRPGMGPNAMPPLIAVQIDSESRLGPPGRGSGPDRRPPQGFAPFDAATLIDRPPRNRPPRDSVRATGEVRGPESDDELHLLLAVDLLRELRAEAPQHLGYALALAGSLQELVSDSLRDRNDVEDSMERDAIALLRELQQQRPTDETIRFALAEALSEFTVFETGLTVDHLEPAIDRLREAVEHFESLSTAHPNVPKYTNALVHSHFKLGVLLERLAALSPHPYQRELDQEASAAFRRAAQRYLPLVRQHPDALGYQAWHALFLQRQGASGIRTGAFEQSERTLLRSIRIWKRLVSQQPDLEISWNALPQSYRLLSRAQHRLEKHDEAEASLLEAEMSRIYLEMEPDDTSGSAE